MKALIDRLNFTSPTSRRSALTLFTAALVFWPAFLLLTVLEEKAGLVWLRTENRALWMPIIALALLSAVAAPLFLEASITRRIAASICSALVFTVIYEVVALVGVLFFQWDN
jgi:hypothetical protein